MNNSLSTATTLPLPFLKDDKGNHFLVAHRTRRVKKADRELDAEGKEIPLPPVHVPVDALTFDCIYDLYRTVAAHRPPDARMVILTNAARKKTDKLRAGEGHVELRLGTNGGNSTLSRFIGDAARNEQMKFLGKHGDYSPASLIVKRLKNKVPIAGDDRPKRRQHDARARLIISALDAIVDFKGSEYLPAHALFDMHAMFDRCDKMDRDREAKPPLQYQVHPNALPRLKPARPATWQEAVKAHPSNKRRQAMTKAANGNPPPVTAKAG